MAAERIPKSEHKTRAQLRILGESAHRVGVGLDAPGRLMIVRVKKLLVPTPKSHVESFQWRLRMRCERAARRRHEPAKQDAHDVRPRNASDRLTHRAASAIDITRPPSHTRIVIWAARTEALQDAPDAVDRANANNKNNIAVSSSS